LCQSVLQLATAEFEPNDPDERNSYTHSTNSQIEKRTQNLVLAGYLTNPQIEKSQRIESVARTIIRCSIRSNKDKNGIGATQTERDRPFYSKKVVWYNSFEKADLRRLTRPVLSQYPSSSRINTPMYNWDLSSPFSSVTSCRYGYIAGGDGRIDSMVWSRISSSVFRPLTDTESGLPLGNLIGGVLFPEIPSLRGRRYGVSSIVLRVICAILSQPPHGPLRKPKRRLTRGWMIGNRVLSVRVA
jgi:hypothetical protein